MADYPDILAGPEYVDLPVAAEPTVIYVDGDARITSHSAPAGATQGIPLKAGNLYPLSADTAFKIKADQATPVTVVRATA